MSMTINRRLFRTTMVAVLVGFVSAGSLSIANAKSHHHYRHAAHHAQRHVHHARHHAVTTELSAHAGISFGFGGGGLVSTARGYIGTNPTGRRSLWCGAFMDVVLKKNGYAPGGNLASAYAHYGVRVSGPQVGAIAVMSRHGGGHVGVVSETSCTPNQGGSGVMVISGNHNHTTGEGCYPRSRIYAYVVPG